MPIQRAAIDQGHDSWLTADKLHIKYESGGHAVYDVKTLTRLPKSLDPHYISTRQSDTSLAFFTGLCPLSNFFECNLTVAGESYHSVEQFYQMNKAQTAGDEHSVARILAAKTPLECKNLGDKVKLGTKAALWDKSCLNIMRLALQQKIAQNDVVRKFLVDTGTKQLGEANGNDTFWGTGIALSKLNSANPANWRGENKLGLLLMELRETLK